MTRPEPAGVGTADDGTRADIIVDVFADWLFDSSACSGGWETLRRDIASAITASRRQAKEEADARVVELEAVLEPFAKAADMLEVAGATTADEIELSGDRLHGALKAARSALRSSQRRSSINPPGEEE